MLFARRRGTVCSRRMRCLATCPQTQSDAAVIEAIEACIVEGIVLKMQLKKEANKRSGVSMEKVLNILEKYTGTEPERHRWFYTTQKHGRKVYQLLS